MGREIKFRAWDKTAKVMHHFDHVHIGRGFGVLLFGFEPPLTVRSVSTESGVSEDDLAHYEIEQFTGLKDKNGKPLYEGDIVKGDGGAKPWFAAVGFEYGCFVLKVPWLKRYFPELKYYIEMTFVDVEVVGNVHQNPELLDGWNQGINQ